MIWPELTKGTLIQRYKRFLADVAMHDATRITAHCPNTGSMLGCSESGRPVYLSHHPHPRRKHSWTWEIIDMGTSLVGINTQNTNRIWAEALQGRNIQEFGRYDRYMPEVKLGPDSRLDFLLTGPDQSPMYMEVKNCTLVQNNVAAFPDAVTKRGQKHLHNLCAVQEAGMQGALIFVVQRMDARSFQPAAWIDPDYARLLRRARDVGVLIKAFDVHLDTTEVYVHGSLPVIWDVI